MCCAVLHSRRLHMGTQQVAQDNTCLRWLIHCYHWAWTKLSRYNLYCCLSLVGVGSPCIPHTAEVGMGCLLAAWAALLLLLLLLTFSRHRSLPRPCRRLLSTDAALSLACYSACSADIGQGVSTCTALLCPMQAVLDFRVRAEQRDCTLALATLAPRLHCHC